MASIRAIRNLGTARHPRTPGYSPEVPKSFPVDQTFWPSRAPHWQQDADRGLLSRGRSPLSQQGHTRVVGAGMPPAINYRDDTVLDRERRYYPKLGPKLGPPVLGQGGDGTSMLPDPGVAVMRGPVGHHRASGYEEYYANPHPMAPGYEEYYANPQHSSVNYLFKDAEPGLERIAVSHIAGEPGGTPERGLSEIKPAPESIPPGIRGLNSFLDGLDNLIASLRIW